MKKIIHFIGIGGIGTSGLAQILNHTGATISGSDMQESDLTKKLQKSGVKVNICHDPKNIPKNCTQVVYSPAIPENNPELVEAHKKGIKCMTYPEALGELSKDYFTIAIAGTHGKSTTTAMTALVCESLDPTVIIGTKIREFGNQNFRIGKSKYLIVEACEYKRSFLHFSPQILAITNIEAEHLDYFKDEKDYIHAFSELAKKVSEKGIVVINDNDKNSKKAVEETKADVLTLNKNLDQQINIKPHTPGDFNITNARFAALVGTELNIPNNKIEQAISEYSGSWRRMENKDTQFKNTRFIDDYAHHPTEIKATLKAIRGNNPSTRILCIFQPHQYSRTYKLLKEFGKSFDQADEVIIPNIYRVRDSEEDIQKISTDDLVDEIKKNKVNAKNGNGLEETARLIGKEHENYDIIITMGAGDITDIYKILTK